MNNMIRRAVPLNSHCCSASLSAFSLSVFLQLLLSGSIVFIDSVYAESLRAREPLKKDRAAIESQGAESQGASQRLLVKFRDEVKARADEEGVLSLLGGTGQSSLKEAETRYGLKYSKAIKLPESRLKELEERAEKRSGVEQPDLAGILVVELEPAQRTEVAEFFYNHPDVEFVEFQALAVPPPADVPPTTPSYENNQRTYLEPPGLDTSLAWGLNAKGQGMRLSICEYGWNYNHEEWADLLGISVFPEPGHDPHPDFNIYWDHGTATLGMTVAGHNGYGVKGIAPQAHAYTFPEYSVQGSYRRETAIANAIYNSSPGDVVLLEMQTYGPGDKFVPAEYSSEVWVLTKLATDAGVVVVAAAGNGAQNLDSPLFSYYNTRPDSGALIVGAGSPLPETLYRRLPESNYGSRVNVQGFGRKIFTAGYCDFAKIGGDANQCYTYLQYSATSAASAMVSGAVLLLQSYRKTLGYPPLEAFELRKILRDTGFPQNDGASTPIGPAINLAAAIAAAVPQVSCDETGKDQPQLLWDSGSTSFAQHSFSYIDPRGESSNGSAVNRGIDVVRLKFDQPVFDMGSTSGGKTGGVLSTAGFSVRQTGEGQAPNVQNISVYQEDKRYVTIRLDRPITLKEWTTIQAEVENGCGLPIVNLGDLGEADEPDRIDIGFLPGDVDQDGKVSPVDLLRFRQMMFNSITPQRGHIMDYVDMSRDGYINLVDLDFFLCSIFGSLPSTQVWDGESMNSPRP